MSHAYKPNEDVHHQTQGPQGRVVTEAPLVYTIVQLCPLRLTDVSDTASRANQGILSE